MISKLSLDVQDYEPTDMVPQTSERRLLLLANSQALPRPVPLEPSTIEPVRRDTLVFPEYVSTPVPRSHNDFPPLTYAAVASSTIEQTRRERAVQHPGYGTTLPVRHTFSAHITPIYPPPTPNIYQNYHNHQTRQNISSFQQSAATYRHPIPRYEQSDNSSGYDCSGTLVVVAIIVVFGLMTWWQWTNGD